MKYLRSLIWLGLASTLLLACDKDETPPPINPTNTVNHMEQLGFCGKLKSVTETTSVYIDGTWEAFDVKQTTFDANGNITSYNPTGMTATYRTPNKRWVGVEMNSYRYTYTENQDLTKAVVTSVGEEETTYSLTYNDVSRCIPLPFPLGTLELPMVKGLQTVASNLEGFSCEIRENEVCYKWVTTLWRDTWRSEITYLYATNDIYPSERISLELSDTEGEVSREHTTFEFSDKGTLKRTTVKRYVYGSLQETENRTYDAAPCQRLILKEIVSADGSRSVWEYRYDENGWLSNISRTDASGTYDEHYRYTNIDAWGNWYVGEFTWNSHVDINHSDDAVKVERILTYL